MVRARRRGGGHRPSADRHRSAVPDPRRGRAPRPPAGQEPARGRGTRRCRSGSLRGGGRAGRRRGVRSTMAARFVAAIDHGTTSTRCILFAPDGTPAAIAQREQTMYSPRPGWVELDMEQVWQRTRECIHDALDTVGATAADVAAIGIANERESVVLWDRRTGRPVGHSITWQDTRTAADADALAADGGIDRFRLTTGLPISTYSSALKLRWLLAEDDDRRAAAERGDLLFGTPDTCCSGT